MKKIIYSLAALLVLSVLGRYLRPAAQDSGYDLAGFAELPVQVGGRIKPLDSVARNTLLVLAARQKVETLDGQTLSPIEWFLDLTMRPERADTHPVFKIEFPDDLGLEGLAQPGKRHYSFNDLRPHFETINQQFREIDPEPKKRDAYQRQIAELNNGLSRYHRVMHSLHPIGDPQRLDQLADEYRSYLSLLQPAMAELRKQQAGEEYNADLVKTFLGFGEDYLRLSQTAHLRVIPPPAPINPMDDWLNLGDELLNVIQTGQLSPYAMSYASLTMAYRAGDAETFNKTLTQVKERVAADFPDDIGRIHFERVFNAYQPFAIAIELYILVFLFVCISWLRWPQALGNAAFWTLSLAFALHTFGLAARMYIQDRPPVTNLYSSAVFVGWGAVLLGAFLERFNRNGIGAAMAALVGFSTLIIAHHLAMTGDTLEMMRAVLDSNFWLATHVVIITLGYSAMFFRRSPRHRLHLPRTPPARLRQIRGPIPRRDGLRHHLVSPPSSASSALSSAASGPTKAGAAFGAGIPKKTAPS
jgi:hypothetical protein